MPHSFLFVIKSTPSLIENIWSKSELLSYRSTVLQSLHRFLQSTDLTQFDIQMNSRALHGPNADEKGGWGKGKIATIYCFAFFV
jgi:hypothetical protein